MTIKNDIDSVGLLLQDYLKGKEINCEYGRYSEGKDALFDLVAKLPNICTFKIDASKNATFKTKENSLRIGSGGSIIDWGDGTTTTLEEGLQGFNHTYTDNTKIYDVYIPNIIKTDEENNTIGLFAYTNNIVEINLPSLVDIGLHTFSWNSNLSKIYLPIAESIGDSSFSTTSIIIADLPNVEQIEKYGFVDCTSLKIVRMPKITTIFPSAFYRDSVLEEIYFALATPPTVQATTSFEDIPTTCKIYVPRGYLEAYQSAANMPNPSTYTYVEYDP